MEPAQNLIFFVLLYCGWIVALCGYGCLFFKLIRWQKIIPVMPLPPFLVFGLSGILGLFFVSLIATIFNFFLPISPEIIFLILLGGFISAYAFRNQITTYLSQTDRIAIYICTIIILILIPLIWKNYYDTGLYHLPAMRWTLESPLTVGLANLHGRFGFNSLWTPLISVIDGFTIILNTPIFLLNGIMTVFFCSIAAIRSIRSYSGQKSLEFSDIFLLFSLIPIFRLGPFYINSTSPDYTILILTLFILYLYLYAYENQIFLKNIFIMAFLLGLFAVTIKMSAIILCFCTVCSLVYYVYRGHNFSIKKSIFSLVTNLTKNVKTYYALLILALLIVIIWLIRGILLSGYVLYPLPWTGIFDFPWSVPLSSAQSDNDWVIGWARNPGPDALSFLHNWTWIPKWFAWNVKYSFSVPIICLIVAVFLLLWRKIYFKSFFMKKEPFLHVTSISVIGVTFWFLSAPAYGFGMGAIFGLSLGFLAWGVYQYVAKDIPFQFSVRQCILVYYILLIIGGATLYHLQTQPVLQLEFPHPAIDSKLTYEGYSVYTLKDGDQLWNSPLPNTPYFQKNISFRYQEGGPLPRLILPA